jgi:archaellum biogenesis ATPase FlaH
MMVWLSDVLAKYSTNSNNYYKKKYFKSQQLKYYSSPLQEVNFTVGLHSITGKSGIGKTTLSLALLRYFRNQGARVLYMNGELPHEQIFARIQSYDSKYSWTDIERDCNIVEDDVRRKTELLLEKVNITGLLSIEEIYYARKFYDVFIIDYLQKIKSKEKDERIRIDSHLEYLTSMVNDYGKIVICINRMPVSAYDKETGHMFQGSGQIEFSSQQCIKLGKADMMDTMSLTVTKNTRGPSGFSKLFKIDYPHQRIIPTSIGARE